MPAFLEPIEYIFRAGPDAVACEHGATGHCVTGVVSVDGTKAVIRGAFGNLTRVTGEELVQKLIDAGYTDVWWRRLKHGKWRDQRAGPVRPLT